MSDIPPRWYVVRADGLALLCDDEDCAQDMAAQLFVSQPDRGPYHAVLLGDVAAAVAQERERFGSVIRLAESCEGRADDCGRLARMILSKVRSATPTDPQP